MTNNLGPKLTSGELSHLWERFMNNSLATVVLDYFQRVLECEDIRTICGFALMTAETEKKQLENFLQQDSYPLPQGFSQTDMNPNAPKPVTDVFVLFFLYHMARLDMASTALSLSDAVRVDIREFYRDRMEKGMELYEKAISLLLDRGLFVRSPQITSTHEAQPLAKDNFMSAFFGAKHRSLTVREANELHKNIMFNYTGKCLLMAFHQSNKNPGMKQLLLRGKELASKIINEFSDVLNQNDLPVAMTWDTHVLDSTESPFSDKLIAFLLDRLNKYGVVNYGYGAAVSYRKDLKMLYARIIADVYQYHEDIISFMVENQWLERPPVALDRRTLAEV